MKKRIFIAITLPALVRENLKQELDNIPGKIVPPENWHYTLQFLEIHDDKKLEKLKFILATLNFGSPFSASLKNVGAFPHENSAKLLWIGLNKGSQELSALAEKITQVLIQEGFKVDTRPYIPHLTIRRFFPHRKVSDIIKNVKIKEHHFLIQEIILYQSILEVDSSRYIHLETYQLH